MVRQSRGRSRRLGVALLRVVWLRVFAGNPKPPRLRWSVMVRGLRSQIHFFHFFLQAAKLVALTARVMIGCHRFCFGRRATRLTARAMIGCDHLWRPPCVCLGEDT